MRRFLKILSWRLGGGRIFRVSGSSMRPAFEPGDLVLLDPSLRRGRGAMAGDVVVARHPYRQNTHILKRVKHLTDEGRIFLAGDDPEESTDSHAFGPVGPSELLGLVVAKLGR